MLKYRVEDYASLGALIYLDIPEYRKGMLFSTYVEQCFLKGCKENEFYQRLHEYVMKQNFYEFMDLEIVNYVNENNHSGLVFYQLEDKNDCYLIYRGSELYDAVDHENGWEDWLDNLEIWLGITNQQLRAMKYFNELNTQKRLHLIGHSKGGNIALFLGVACSDEKMSQIDEIVTFNAPGINDDMMMQYKKRIQDIHFKNKILCIENENDPISSMFSHVKEPVLVSSIYKGASVEEAYHSHQIWAYEKKDGYFVSAAKKSILPRLADLVSNHFVNLLDEENKKKFVHKFMEYCQNDCSLEEMYHVVLYNIGIHQNLLSEDEDFRSVEIQTLLSLFQKEMKEKVISIPESVKTSFDEVKSKVEGWVNQVGKKQ